MLDSIAAELWLDEQRQPELLHPLFEPVLPYPLQASSIDVRYNNSRIKEVPILLEEPMIL